MESAPAWASTTTAPPPPQQTTTSVVEQHEQELFAKYSTLDEPVLETILRDVHAVYDKLRVVMMPLDHSTTLLSTALSYSAVSTTQNAEDDNNANNNQQQQQTTTTTTEVLSDHDKMVIKKLKDWDLWGPLILCLTLAVILSFKAPKNQASLVFASVFCAVWVGGLFVTVNAQLLGGTISFFQSLCVLGYSIFPLTVAALIIGLLKIVIDFMWLDLIFVGVGCVWAMRTSSVFISLYIQPERRALALYPVVFFYVFLAWLILLF